MHLDLYKNDLETMFLGREIQRERGMYLGWGGSGTRRIMCNVIYATFTVCFHNYKLFSERKEKLEFISLWTLV